jgi:predicted nucleic acid-binding protein
VTTVILDNEALAAVRDVHHPHHKRVLAFVEANRSVNRKEKARRTVVPTAVRVEANWDRTSPAAATINRFRIEDVALDGAVANLAATIHNDHHVSVADAHIGATIQRQPAAEEIVVITSDPDDVGLVAGTRTVRVITL